MRQKIWKYKNKNLNQEKLMLAAKEASVSPVIMTLLFNRGITDIQQIQGYMAKSMQSIHNPMLLPGMAEAVKRIQEAVESQERIVIYGDYDVDGITSTALLYSFLQECGANVSYYIPDRREEGYGINIMAVNKLAKKGTKLLITVDCGITAVGEVEFARLQGMDTIITDHHTCKEKIPAALAVINPKRPDCDYPFDALAGVGVAFKLILALAMAFSMNTTQVFRDYVELAAIGTIADVVPLLDENRIIADRGLKGLADTRREGLRALIKIAGVDRRPITAATVAFALSPRLNAAGRLGSAKTAVELLLTKDSVRAEQIAAQLDLENKERQMMEQQILNEALEMIAADPNFEKKRVAVLAKEGWHQGVIGIVASRINDLYYKPCILISCEDGKGKGSGRSIPAFNLFDALSACGDLLSDFGGHAIAAGLNISCQDIEPFAKKINEYAQKRLSDEDMVPSVAVDCELPAAMVSVENAKYLSKLEPFGMGNEAPVFSMHNLEILNIGQIGIDNKHLRLRLKCAGRPVQAVAFHMGEYFNRLKKGDLIDAVFQLDVNTYQDMESVQLKIKDIKKSSV